jgi:hypothetical protein
MGRNRDFDYDSPPTWGLFPVKFQLVLNQGCAIDIPTKGIRNNNTAWQLLSLGKYFTCVGLNVVGTPGPLERLA